MHFSKCIYLALLLFMSSTGLFSQQAAGIFPDMEGEALQLAIVQAFKPGQVLSYRDARDTMYALIDNHRDTVYGLYSNHGVYLPEGVDPSIHLFQDGAAGGINCEHVWPRSKGAKYGPPKSDMHHLFPTRVSVNQARGNYPFGEVEDTQTRRWFYQSFERNSLPAASSIDDYSELGSDVFEPREAIKGDVARALFYFFTMYREEAGQEGADFFYTQLKTLCHWNRQDPPSTEEIERTIAIARYQDGKPNPFIIDPRLAERLYCD